MASDLGVWHTRVKDVERHFQAARLALHRFNAEVERDPSALPATMKPRDVRDALATSEATYMIRLFAEFESALRSYWLVVRKRRGPSRTRDLIDGIAADRTVEPRVIASVHEVREARNSLVHEGKPSQVPTLGDVRQRLCHFLAFLPPSWGR